MHVTQELVLRTRVEKSRHTGLPTGRNRGRLERREGVGNQRAIRPATPASTWFSDAMMPVSSGSV